MASLGEDLLGIVNKLQDLVFNTIGNDSLDLPQIVCPAMPLKFYNPTSCREKPNTNTFIGCCRFAIIRKVISA